MMKYIALLMFFCGISLLAVDDALGVDGYVARSRTAVSQLMESLQVQLMAAMQTGGPVEAIEVCQIQAHPIAIAVSRDQGMQIRRVSMKTRNPENAPNDWQTQILERFEERKRSGEAPNSLEAVEWAEGDGQREFRYMMAIPTGSLCLQCHGESLTDEVQKALLDGYPLDQARGFKLGDLRGAFVVTQVVED